jgi:hypothetical protein
MSMAEGRLGRRRMRRRNAKKREGVYNLIIKDLQRDASSVSAHAT